MHDVIIDGIPYTAGTAGPRIGIGITTRNRNKILAEALRHHHDHLPPGARLVVVDDASDKPVDGADHRFDTCVGVATAKNKCLELLNGCDHYFLFDDDVWPVVDLWWQPYIDSPEPHLAHTFGQTPIWADDRHTAYHASGGTILYYTAQVIADVGGMRTVFGPWGYEHTNLSDRIHNRGWTTWRYADITGADQLFHELDRDRQKTGHKSTATPAQRAHSKNDGRDLWMSLLDDREYVEYRQLDDVIITHLFTAGTASRSGRGYKPDTSAISDLAKSIQHGRLIVFHDQLDQPKLATGNGRPVEFVQVESPRINVFYQRHQTTWQWLRDHPEVGRVWAVDGTDVQQLRDPFTPLQPDRIHLGWEPVTQSSPWMIKNYPEARYQAFVADHPHEQLLNAGVIGGDRTTMLAFLHQLIRYHYDTLTANIQVWQPKQTAVIGPGDMAGLQLVAYSDDWRDRIVTGTRITTVFKQQQGDNGMSLWAHK